MDILKEAKKAEDKTRKLKKIYNKVIQYGPDVLFTIGTATLGALVPGIDVAIDSLKDFVSVKEKISPEERKKAQLTTQQILEGLRKGELPEIDDLSSDKVTKSFAEEYVTRIFDKAAGTYFSTGFFAGSFFENMLKEDQKGDFLRLPKQDKNNPKK